MSDLKQVLSDEIRRLARKEVKAAVVPLQQIVSAQKKVIADLAKRIKELEAAAPQPAVCETPVADSAADSSVKFRISPDGIRKLREKRGLTQLQLAQLLDVNQFTISNWEQGKNKPRRGQKEALAQLRKMGKREFKALALSKIPDFKVKGKQQSRRKVEVAPEQA